MAKLKAQAVAWTIKAPIAAAITLFAAGIVAWGAFNTTMEATNNLPFCISCHEMRSTVYEEYRHTVHFANPSGVQATCPDCHVPKDWTAKVIRKIQASNELFHWMVGTISTPEKFEARRPELASRVWAAMKKSDSRECRNCHNFSAMDTSGQGRFARRLHEQGRTAGQTCIDCHKGISHQLPAPPKQSLRNLAKIDEELVEEINMTCAPCHGRHGEGRADGTYPRLAGLEAAYLARQIANFKSKQRINIPMAPYATDRELPDSDVRTITSYLASIELPRKLALGDDAPTDALARLNQTKAVLNIPLYPGDIGRGRRLYDKECAACHARNGYGDPTRLIPPLAGQHSLYLKRQIENFAKGDRNHDDPADTAIFKSFTADQIADMLAYVSTLDD
jgi:cytochrome c-type protein NapC